jgi:hypothetical protein
MKKHSVSNILLNFRIKYPKLILCRIDKFSNIVKNYNNIKGGCKNINQVININKYIDKYKNDKEEYKIIIIVYKNINYTFKIYHDNEIAYYYLFRTNDNNENLACVHIIVDKNNNICEIHNILYHKDCMPTAEMNDKKGSILMKIALILINKIKDKYKINKIYLTDNSKKICKNKEIELHKMLTLLTGTTWYGKYGFIPVNKILRKQFEQNKNIIENTNLKDVPQLKKYLIKILKNKNDKILEKIMISYDQAIKINSKLNKYLQFFLHNYDNNCYIFYLFYEQLYTDLKLTNMGNQQFIKEI